jgi:hypothetical protein
MDKRKHVTSQPGCSLEVSAYGVAWASAQGNLSNTTSSKEKNEPQHTGQDHEIQDIH